ncbi:MAG: sulfatase-like hydrolase/transferase, partial [Planctomycetota bacterium]
MRRLALTLTVLAVASAYAADKPNVLFIISDDQCWRTLGGINNPELDTPNLDALAARGSNFTHCYNQGAWGGAVCVASRAMVNSGLSVHRAKGGLHATTLWGEVFQAAGYDTFFTG